MLPELPSPWREFLTELDDLLNEPCELHCIGGFAVVAVYGLPRSTNDLDYYSIVPQHCTDELERIAGEGSDLARKHKVHVHHASVASLPESYEERMTELFAGRFKNLRLLVLDPYDLVLSKLSRNVERDREDVEYVVKTQHLDAAILRARYEQELKPYLIGPVERHDN
ncbi:MAG: DUF6036 family nucleotidyltransferase, partial [Candidatus Acidiferrales bacterium]